MGYAVIRITVELHPFGDASRKKVIGRMDIWNDASGDAYTGNYRFSYFNGDEPTKRTKWRTGFVRGFARKSKKVWELIKLCLEAEQREIYCDCGKPLEYFDGKCHSTHVISPPKETTSPNL